MNSVHGMHVLYASLKATVSIEDYVCHSMDVGRINAFHSYLITFSLCSETILASFCANYDILLG